MTTALRFAPPIGDRFGRYERNLAFGSKNGQHQRSQKLLCCPCCAPLRSWPLPSLDSPLIIHEAEAVTEQLPDLRMRRLTSFSIERASNGDKRLRFTTRICQRRARTVRTSWLPTRYLDSTHEHQAAHLQHIGNIPQDRNTSVQHLYVLCRRWS